MSTFEIIGSILLIITCILITIAILLQGSKKSGISALGGQDTYFSKDGSRSTEAKLVLYTKILAGVFFALTIATYAFSLYA